MFFCVFTQTPFMSFGRISSDGHFTFNYYGIYLTNGLSSVLVIVFAIIWPSEAPADSPNYKIFRANVIFIRRIILIFSHNGDIVTGLWNGRALHVQGVICFTSPRRNSY